MDNILLPPFRFLVFFFFVFFSPSSSSLFACAIILLHLSHISVSYGEKKSYLSLLSTFYNAFFLPDLFDA